MIVNVNSGRPISRSYGEALCRRTRGVVFTLGLLAAFSTASAEQEISPQEAFFKRLSQLCGETFTGRTEFPEDPAHPMVGKKLLVAFGPCRADEIRVPFQVGEDKSRTWILTLSKDGLLLKHDHRHPDGTPDKITMYGGWADQVNGSAARQYFRADEETARLLPEAATNVWRLEIDEEKRQLIYALMRNDVPRYRAVFDLRPRDGAR